MFALGLETGDLEGTAWALDRGWAQSSQAWNSGSHRPAHPSESPPTLALPGKSLAGLRGGGGPAAGPAPPGSQSGLCLRQPGAQRSHRGPGLGLARADSGPGAGPGKEGGTKAPEGAGPRLRRDAEHSSGYSWLSVPESKKWGPDLAASLVKGFPAPDILVRLDPWAWTSAFRMQRDTFPPPTSIVHTLQALTSESH